MIYILFVLSFLFGFFMCALFAVGKRADENAPRTALRQYGYDLMVHDLIDVAFSHNSRVAIWVEDEEDPHYSKLVWVGMAWNMPVEYRKMKFKKIFGMVAEHISDSDIINIKVFGSPLLPESCTVELYTVSKEEQNDGTSEKM